MLLQFDPRQPLASTRLSLLKACLFIMDEVRKPPGHFCSLSCLESKRKACCCVVLNKSQLAQCSFLKGEASSASPATQVQSTQLRSSSCPNCPFFLANRLPSKPLGCATWALVCIFAWHLCAQPTFHLWLSVSCKPRKHIGINHDTADSGLVYFVKKALTLEGLLQIWWD